MEIRFNSLRFVAIFIVAVSLVSCTDYNISFSSQPCVPQLDFDVTRADGFECPCQTGPSTEGSCSPNVAGENRGGTWLIMEGSHYRLELTIHHETESGDVLEVHDISGLSADERSSLGAPERGEVWMSFEGPTADDLCAEGLDEDEYPGMISDLSGTITVDEFTIDPEIPYLNASFDVSSVGVVTPSADWELAGNAEMEAGFHPDELETDEPDDSNGGGDTYVCDARCEYEHHLCEDLGHMVGCYCAAACLCECTLDVGNYTGADAQEWEDCVTENRDNAEMIYDPDAVTYGEGGEEIFTGTGHPCDQLK